MIGRPPKPASEKQSERLVLHLTRAEMALVAAAAAKQGIPLATWVRRRAVQNAMPPPRRHR